MKNIFYILLLISSIMISTLEGRDTETKKIVRITHEFDLSCLTDCFCDQAGYFIGEGGENHWRLNGTLGVLLLPGQRLKITGEYLAGKNCYNFVHGDQKPWIHQIAFGGVYQMDLCWDFLKTVDLGASYSQSFGEGFENINNGSGTLISQRRIAGADYYDVFIGTDIPTFCGGSLHIFGSYEYLRYNRKYNSDKVVKGLGGGFFLDQPISNEINLSFLGDFRQAYTFYELGINRVNHVPCGVTSTGLFFSHVSGKHKLNNENRIGLSFGLNFCCAEGCCRRATRCGNDFYSWVRRPAVYRPRVLAIADANECIPAEALTDFYSVENLLSPNFTDDLSRLFNGSNLTFSSPGLPPNVSLDPNTGVLTGLNVPQGEFLFNVTATNDCGTATIQVFLRVVLS